MNQAYKWRFARFGGIDRVSIEKGEDLMHLDQLDQKLWTALSCPVNGLELDSRTLQLMDADADGRLRVPEILAAIKWVGSVLKNPDVLIRPQKDFPLSAINDSVPEGKQLLLSAKQILSNIGKSGAETITVEETSDTVRIFADTIFNGDGIITADSAENEFLGNLINEIISVTGSVTDRSGKPGISTEILDKFYSECEAFSSWHALAEANQESILPFGDKTPDALNIYEKVKAKIDDYFLRCRLAAFDPRSADTLNILVSRYESISPKDLSTCIDEIATFPLAFIRADKALLLSTGINPAWESDMAAFKSIIIDVALKNCNELTESVWNEISGKFAAYKDWMSKKVGSSVEGLGLQKVRELLAGEGKQQLTALIEKDKALEAEANSIACVDKLVRYYRDLYTLLKNFVSFNDFYSSDAKAIFQAGTLYIDRRSCDLCIRVNDVSKHSVMAGFSGMYLMYCDCVSRSGKEKMQIVVGLTNGDIDNLMVGRNGVFYDRKGQDWDATIVKIIENSVSIRQAFWAPYRSINKMIGSQIEKFAASKEKEVMTSASSNVEATGTKIESIAKEPVAAPPPPPAVPFDIGKFVGIFAAISLAIGALGTAIVAIVSGFFKLSWWQMPLALAGLILAVSGPSMILAFLKLRKRNLAPLLDANGWAINARAIINISFGRTLTSVAKLPLNAERNLHDPYSTRKFPLWLVLLILVVVAAIYSYIACRMGWMHCPWFKV